MQNRFPKTIVINVQTFRKGVDQYRIGIGLIDCYSAHATGISSGEIVICVAIVGISRHKYRLMILYSNRIALLISIDRLGSIVKTAVSGC